MFGFKEWTCLKITSDKYIIYREFVPCCLSTFVLTFFYSSLHFVLFDIVAEQVK